MSQCDHATATVPAGRTSWAERSRICATCGAQFSWTVELAASYTIRPAVRSDSRFVYELAMDPRIRMNSTRQEEFGFAEHDRWWADKIAHPELHRIWVMEVGGIPVGQCRYGRTPGCRYDEMDASGFTKVAWIRHECAPGAEVAISVVPREWRKGYALALLQETIPLACEWLKVDTLVALVLRGNYASRRLFRRAGFRFVGAEWRMGRCHARYEWGSLLNEAA